MVIKPLLPPGEYHKSAKRSKQVSVFTDSSGNRHATVAPLPSPHTGDQRPALPLPSAYRTPPVRETVSAFDAMQGSMPTQPQLLVAEPEPEEAEQMVIEVFGVFEEYEEPEAADEEPEAADDDEPEPMEEEPQDGEEPEAADDDDESEESTGSSQKRNDPIEEPLQQIFDDLGFEFARIAPKCPGRTNQSLQPLRKAGAEVIRVKPKSGLPPLAMGPTGYASRVVKVHLTEEMAQQSVAWSAEHGCLTKRARKARAARGTP